MQGRASQAHVLPKVDLSAIILVHEVVQARGQARFFRLRPALNGGSPFARS